jgi:two-component system sensor histidine kinase BaeS
VTVTLRQEGPMLALTIADDGAGVEIDELPRLTEPRFRGRSSRSAQIEGQGLGLSIVREIVTHHDGKLAIDSRPGEGLSATVHFPLEPQAQEVYHTTRRVMAGGRRYA